MLLKFHLCQKYQVYCMACCEYLSQKVLWTLFCNNSNNDGLFPHSHWCSFVIRVTIDLLIGVVIIELIEVSWLSNLAWHLQTCHSRDLKSFLQNSHGVCKLFLIKTNINKIKLHKKLFHATLHFFLYWFVQNMWLKQVIYLQKTCKILKLQKHDGLIIIIIKVIIDKYINKQKCYWYNINILHLHLYHLTC